MQYGFGRDSAGWTIAGVGKMPLSKVALFGDDRFGAGQANAATGQASLYLGDVGQPTIH